MMKLIRYMCDVLVVIVLIGSIYFLFLAKAAGPQGRRVNGFFDWYAAISFAVLVLLQLSLAFKVTWGLWDTDAVSRRLK